MHHREDDHLNIMCLTRRLTYAALCFDQRYFENHPAFFADFDTADDDADDIPL
jgi:hypothetical protein